MMLGPASLPKPKEPTMAAFHYLERIDWDAVLVLQLCFLRTLPISLADLYGGVEYGGRIDERSRLAK
jgi:hypothetical protein